MLPALVRASIALQNSFQASSTLIDCSSRALSHAAASTSAKYAAALKQLNELPFELPKHEIEDDLPRVPARVRGGSGSNYCGKMRRAGRTPALAFSLPGERTLPLDLSTKDASALVRKHGRNGLLARVLRVDLEAADGRPLGSLRVLAKAVHVNAATLDVENLRLMYLPRDRKTLVNVPITLWGADAAPGVKAGGWMHMANRTVPLQCEGWAVPPSIELDVRRMRAQQVVRLRDVPPPAGCALRAKDPIQPAVRCALKSGGE